MSSTFPADLLLAADNFDFRVTTNTQVFTSDLSASVKTGSLPGDHWSGTATWGKKDGDVADQLVTFFRSLGGRAGRFTMWPFDRPLPKGTALGTPVVSGADQTGTTLTTSGWTPSQTGVLKAGDYFQVGDELKQLSADANADGSGNATLTFYPPIRVSPADASSVVIEYPRGVFMLTDDPGSSVTSPVIYSISIAFREVV